MTKNKHEEAGLINSPTPTHTLSDESSNTDRGLLKLLEGAFLAPMLSLVQIYLYRSNGSKKTIENCTLDFRNNHPRTWKLFFCIDFLFRLIYMSVVLIVVIRGLAIGDYILSLVN